MQFFFSLLVVRMSTFVRSYSDLSVRANVESTQAVAVGNTTSKTNFNIPRIPFSVTASLSFTHTSIVSRTIIS